MNIIDCLYTDAALSRGGEEANPVMNWLLLRYGMGGIFAAKAAALVFMACFVNILPKYQYLRWFFYLAVSSYTALTIYHVSWYYHGLTAWKSLVL